MPFPFVSRATFDLVDAAHLRLEETLAKALDNAEHRAAQLLNETQRLNGVILDMRREGFGKAPERPVAAPQAPRLPSSVEFAIERIAGKDGALTRKLSAFAEAELAAKRSTDDVIAAIERGDETDDGA